MQKRRLGHAGPEVSLVGLGANNFGGRTDLQSSRRVVDRALDLGITLIDTADAYGNKGGSEEILGQVLGPRRKQIVLATKFGLPMDDAGKLKEHRRVTSRRPSRRACAVSIPTGSISINYTGLIQIRRSRRRCARSTIL